MSIVLVNWNAGSVIEGSLAAITPDERTGDPVEVVLVDNASTDDSVERARRAYPELRVVQNRDNVGYARAVNQGLRATGGDLVLIMNPDVILGPGALHTLAACLREHPGAAIVGPRLLNVDGSVQASARRDPSVWTGLFGRTTLLTRLAPRNPLSRRELPALTHRGAAPVEVDWVSGACLLARRAAFDQAGLLDEGFFLFWEDADWCRRHRAAGWQVLYAPAAVATHHIGVSRAQRRLRSTLDFHRSAYRYYRKHALPSPWHPMMSILVGGLALSFVRRSVESALDARRGRGRAGPATPAGTPSRRCGVGLAGPGASGASPGRRWPR